MGRGTHHLSIRRAAAAAALVVVALAPVALAPAAWVGEPTPEITSGELLAHIKYLSDDALEGRAAGSAGARAAAEYIAAEFERLGLEPAGDAGTYFQGFTVPGKFRALPETSLVAHLGGRRLRFRFEREVMPAWCSAPGKASGEAVFAGYGISWPQGGYDDYAGADVKGKIVLVLAGLPENELFVARRHGSLRAKQDLAASLGAAGLLVVSGSKDLAAAAAASGRVGRKQGSIPCLVVAGSVGGKLLSRSGLSVARARKQIDAALEPVTRPLASVTVEMNAALVGEEIETRNVAGLLRSRAQNRIDEALVVGGHYDHLGRGYFGSLGGPKARGQVHNGADDNASGTSGVLELAGWLAPRVGEIRRDVLFLCFSAEEMGLLGSKHYTDSPLLPLGKTVAMLNMDMIGYLKNGGRLQVYGAGTSPSFKSLLARAGRAARVRTMPIRGVGPGNSDHYPFYRKGLPVLFFFTGLHKNYHRPSDDWRYIDRKGIERVVRLVAEVADEIATAEARPPFTPSGEGALETGPYLGAVLADVQGEVVVTSVARGSPAARVGLRKNDRLVEVNDREIDSAGVFYGIWSEVDPKKRVTLVIRRNGRLRTLRFRLK